MSRAPTLAALAPFALALLGGCEASSTGREYENICGPTPDHCLGRTCVTSVASPSYEDCCDSYYCNCNPETHAWTGYFCDLPPPPEADASPDATPDAAPDAAPDASPDGAP